MPTEILPADEYHDTYPAVKRIIMAADWDAIAEILSDSKMRTMKARTLRKVLQNDPLVDQTLREFIRAVDSASEDAIIFG